VARYRAKLDLYASTQLRAIGPHAAQDGGERACTRPTRFERARRSCRSREGLDRKVDINILEACQRNPHRPSR
jgi:hypothetical protein